MKGKLYILSGPSGAGKGTVCKQLIKERPDIVLSISMTTRPPRADEKKRRKLFFHRQAVFSQN